MPRDDAALLDIVRAARRCLDISTRLDEATFHSDVDDHGSMLYGLVVLGEAARRLSDEFRTQHRTIP